MDIQGLKQYVESLIKRGASAAEISRKCGISDAAMSQFRSGKYGAREDSISEKIASALNYYENTWKIVDTVTSYQQIRTAFNVAKRNRKWICISSRSGSGKTSRWWTCITSVWIIRSFISNVASGQRVNSLRSSRYASEKL